MDVRAEYRSQGSYCCRLDWGRDGVRRAAFRRDIVVIVDVLRFSTAVVVALQHGAVIYPCAPADDAAALAQRSGAAVAAYGHGAQASEPDPLSPASYRGVAPGARLVLASPNGAACSRYGREVPYLFVGALANAAAVGAAVAATLQRTGLAVTLIACGERWPSAGEDGGLRFAVEDYLGAGAILSHLPFEKSPEALLCQLAFRAARGRLPELLQGSSSGRELSQKGRDADVELAAQLDRYEAVPIMRQECLELFHPSMLE